MVRGLVSGDWLVSGADGKRSSQWGLVSGVDGIRCVCVRARARDLYVCVF